MQPNTYIQEDDAWIYYEAYQEFQNLNNYETR